MLKRLLARRVGAVLRGLLAKSRGACFSPALLSSVAVGENVPVFWLFAD
jgi:hypothetical protein